MSYSKSIFFVPVWFNDFKQFTGEIDKMDAWESADYTKLWVKYLYPYASSLSKTERRNKLGESQKPKKSNKIPTVEKRKEDVFAHYIIKDLSAAQPYMYEDVLQLQGKVTLEEVRFSCFATGVAFEMLERLGISPDSKLKTLSKGNKEKVCLILVMSRAARLYVLDEPIAGVDPAARDYVISTIINNYNPDATVLISTHLIADIEQILDEVIFIKNGSIVLHSTVDEIRTEHEKSVDELFREVFKW